MHSLRSTAKLNEIALQRWPSRSSIGGLQAMSLVDKSTKDLLSLAGGLSNPTTLETELVVRLDAAETYNKHTVAAYRTQEADTKSVAFASFGAGVCVGVLLTITLYQGALL